ncbi:TIGR03087 family PEP-CTERM/XrtA system glycosyltransferase [soil metagenome]
MGNLLYLVHRLPFPPNKGDKVRSYHLLKHLAARHRVFLGTFVDDPEDEQHVASLAPLCAGIHAARLNPRTAKIASLSGLLTGEALTNRYYQDAGLARWVAQTAAEQALDASVVFSSSMAQYAQALPAVPMLVDFVDLDSAKWTQYAEQHRWPMSWIYRREGERLLGFERTVASQAQRSFFVTENETALFRERAPECAGSVEAMNNGVDATYFAPDANRESPFPQDVIPLVFTGAMDYWPNVDAVTWFAQESLPALRAVWPRLRFFIVGRAPTAAVQALASDAVVVTGTVPDVRPYLQHAAAVVAPLRLARGIQNKILEAMAMARPVVASQSCAESIDATAGIEFLAAASADEFASQVGELLKAGERADQIGQAGRQRVLARYSWDAHLSGIDRYLTGAPVLKAAA